MFDTEKYIDAVFTECARVGEFQAETLVQKFVEPELSGEDAYYQKKNVTNALGFLESKRLCMGETRPEFTRNLRLLKEVRYGKLSAFGKVVTHAPAFLRVGLFAVLYRWKGLVSALGALASVKLLNNTYQGAMLLMGFVEYLAFLVLLWVIYFLIRRALN